MRVLCCEHYERHGLFVIHITGVCREPVHTTELTAIGLTANPGGQVVEDLALVVALGLPAGQLGDRLLGRQPIAGTLAIQIPGVFVEPS